MKKQKSTTARPTPLIQWIKDHPWIDGCEIRTEYTQARQEGRDLKRVESEFKKLLAVRKASESGESPGGTRDEAWLAAAGKLVDKVQTQPQRKDYHYFEPSDLQGIKAARSRRPKLKPWKGSREEFLRRLHGGLLGRIAGCMLGKPLEGWDRRSIRINSEATANWPLTNYARLSTAAEDKVIEREKPKTHLKNKKAIANLFRDGIDGMVEDDDINYTTIGLAIVQKYGANFSPVNVASFWGWNVPIFHTCTAERIAYRNFCNNILPPQSAVYRNPYREWIGAQIRADYFGYANPGDPSLAAEWGWRDASISHVKNGIYGEMWVAAMLAAAYVEGDWVKVIRAGLAEIPSRSRLREDVEKIIGLHAAGSTYEEAVEAVHTQWDESNPHDWCHTNSNAQIVAIGLLYGEDAYEKTIARAVMPAFDTDCNGATCGSLWGIKHGVNAIPEKWSRPLRDLVRTGVAGYHEVAISKLAEDMVETAVKVKRGKK